MGGLPLSEQKQRGRRWGKQDERREGKLWLGSKINEKNWREPLARVSSKRKALQDEILGPMWQQEDPASLMN